MMWAKTERKPFLTRPRMTMMSLYTVSLCLLSLAAFAAESEPLAATSYRVTADEAQEKIAEEISSRGLGENITVNILGRRNTDLVTRNEPVMMEVADLKLEEKAQRFNARLHFSTEAALNKPARDLGNMEVVGRYEEMVEVPVMKFRLSDEDVIREEDLEMQKMPSSRVRRDTVTNMAELVGKSPARALSPNRPIRTAEIKNPSIVKRASLVKMVYQSGQISIHAVGTALEDGAKGDKIKVRNDDSGAELVAQVSGRGMVEIIPTISLNYATN